MTKDLRTVLLETYRENQGEVSSPGVYADVRAMWPHFEANYLPLLTDEGRDSRVLELGGGPGHFLAWLKAKGFTDLTGVDASPGDVAVATALLGEGIVQEGDAFAFARAHPDSYDLVVMKALLEHVPKDELLAAVEAVGRTLKDGGLLIVEVPNMGWLLAGHERYLDLTHEVGFTRQSLTTLLSLCFDDVRVGLSRLANPTTSQRMVRPLLVRIIRRALYIVGEGADGVDFASRSLLAVARKPRRS